MRDLVARVEVAIDAPAETVWRALTEPDSIAQFMFGARVITDWQPGSAITYEGEWKGKPYRDKGEVLEVVPKRLLKTTHFSPLSGKADVPENYNVVTYELTSRSGRTMVRVIQ